MILSPAHIDGSVLDAHVQCTSVGAESVLCLWMLKRAATTQQLANFELWSSIARNHVAPFFTPTLCVKYRGSGDATYQRQYLQLLSGVVEGSLRAQGLCGVEYQGAIYNQTPCHDGHMYSDDCDFRPSIYSKNPNEISYILADIHGFDVETSRHYALCEHSDSESMFGVLENIARHVHRFGSEFVVFDGMDMRMTNKSGFNHDHRGSDHCRLGLAIERFQLLLSPFSLADLLKAILRLKSHKFDFWYELFTRITVAHQAARRDIPEVALEFDHGS